MIYTYVNTTIEKVVDGDTFDSLVDMGFNIFHRVRFRLYGINCPEMAGATAKEGLKAKMRVVELLLHKMVTVQCLKYDKYGRSVAKVTLQTGEDLTTLLLAENLGVPYMADANLT